MFGGKNFSKSLDDDVFNLWLEKGRTGKIKYQYLLIIWDRYESEYRPEYLAVRDDIESFKMSEPRDILVAVYDLYSESRILI